MQASHLLTSAGTFTHEILTDLFTNDPEVKTLGRYDNAKDKALCLETTLRGTATMARSGVQLSELEYVIDHSLKGMGL